MKRKQHVVLAIATVSSLLLLSSSALAGSTYSVGQIVPISEVNASATPMPKPTLFSTGVPLIVSDSPETIYGPTGAYYRDRVRGEFRVFFHHQNETGHTINTGAAVTNTGTQPVMLFVHGQGTAISIYPDVAGQQAEASFLTTRHSRTLLATLQPGETYFYGGEVPQDNTRTGFVQFEAVTQQGQQPADVAVTTLSYEQAPADYLAVPVLPAQDGVIRGTFSHSDRVGTVVLHTSAGKQYLNISAAPFGIWADAMPGEYEVGADAVDGGTPVWNDGNYGVAYDLTVSIFNDSHQPMPYSLIQNPAGGWGHYAMVWNNDLQLSPWIWYGQGWVFAHFNLPAVIDRTDFGTSLVGGSAGPSKIFFVPGQ